MPGLFAEISAEIARATVKFPLWRTDPFHAISVVSEEVGEVHKALIELVYEPEKGVTRANLRAEAVQMAAMALSFISELDNYDYTPGPQHEKRLF